MQLAKFFKLFFYTRSVFFIATIFSLIIVLNFSESSFAGDEPRYLSFAENIVNGFYAKKDLKPGFLWNGPGYPLIISPLKKLNASILSYKILNVAFIVLGIYFLYKLLNNFFNKNISLLIALIGGYSHPYIFHALTRILTESFSFFLVNASIYFSYKFFISSHKKYLIYSSIFSLFLILTKVFFYYVYLVIFLITCFFYLIKKLDFKFANNYILPLILCIPYFVYTFSLTNKPFYLSDAGGSTLYSMSTPYEDEYCDWFSASIDTMNPVVGFSKEGSITTKPKTNPPYFQRHLPFLVSISSLNGVQRDENLKKKAIENIINHPTKYFKNISSNISRIFFRAPFTDRELKTSFKLIFYTHGFVLLTCYIFSLFSTLFIMNRTTVKIITLFVLISLFGISLLSAESRFIFPIYGIFISLISIQIKNFISWRSQKKYQ